MSILKLRHNLMQERKVDPAVLVNVPEEPSADQLEQASTAAIQTGGAADKKSGAR